MLRRRLSQTHPLPRNTFRIDRKRHARSEDCHGDESLKAHILKVSCFPSIRETVFLDSRSRTHKCHWANESVGLARSWASLPHRLKRGWRPIVARALQDAPEEACRPDL